MSVINQMLKDLDRRQQEAEGAAVYVAPVRQQGWWMLVLTLLCTLALGILGWRTWIFWQQSLRASPASGAGRGPRTPLRWRHPRPWRWWPPRRRSPLLRQWQRCPPPVPSRPPREWPLRSRAGSGR